LLQFAELRNQLAEYLNKEQVELVALAYSMAEKAHTGQLRSSGDEYITHPVAVAQILADMHMDHQSIIAAILHDVIEDTSISKEEIAATFGEKVAELVDGVSKLAQLKFESRAEAQAENLRKMMLAMARDIRVILIKLADRLHNMRTLEALSRDKQRRIALETLEIYAPIANRLGMNNFRVEFEDLGFSYLYPVRYRVLKEAVRKARGNRKEIINSIEEDLQTNLKKHKIKPKSIVGREKHLYSLYRKMRFKDLSLSEIMDVYALRIVVKDVDSCYRVLGIVHSMYKPVHGRFKDYIAVPKANGYQSLHTTVLGHNGVPVEIQIRTEEMNNMAENGISAHWLYKSFADENSGNEAETRAREWLKGLLELQNNTGSSLEFIEHVKIDLYPDEVYVFTPTGEILSLPSGATCVDFAYSVHTDVGNSCIAAKIDRRLVPLSSRLSSGQTIEIITADGAHPNPAWLSFVVTGKARSNIRHWLKTQQISESRQLGKRLLERALAALSLTLETTAEENYVRVAKELKLSGKEELFEEVGLGNQMAPLVARRLAVDSPKDAEQYITPLAIKGTEGMVVSYAKCCRPIPGDPILGFLSAGRGMVIHRDNCNNVAEVRRYPEKYVFVQWADEVIGEFAVDLRVDVLNKRGVLATLANALSDCNANIENVHVEERDERHSALVFLIHIKDRKHLAHIIRRLRSISIVIKVSRVK
jgi:RelA/SpoT family (p)ppGpp synthetase